MSEEEKTHSAGDTASASRAQTPGDLLRHERERVGRTVQEFADEMHLGVHMIEAMEANRFSVLGAPVFARGHLRKYATLLGVSVERVHQLYEAVADRPLEPDPVPVIHRATEPSIPMSPDSRDRRVALQPAQWVLVIAAGALALVVLIAWLFVGGDKEQAAPSEAVPAPTPTETVAPPAAPAPAEPAAATPSSPPAVAAAQPAAAATVAPRPTASTARKVQLRFTFTQESWVEVYDTRDTRLLYDVGQPGQSRNVQVDPPAKVVLGFAGGVSTEVNGNPIEVPARRIAGQRAEFTVQADGSVQ